MNRFVEIAGHGGKLRDNGKNGANGYDETLIPLDYYPAGEICDDDLLEDLAMKFRSGIFVTSMMDCYHSGTVLDLPYDFKANGSSTGMEGNENYDFDKMEDLIGATVATGAAGMAAATMGECCKIS